MAGLQTWDEATGNPLIDFTTRLAKELGVVTIGGAGSPRDGAIYDPRFAWGKPFYFDIGGTFQADAKPQISISDNYLRWHFPYADGSQPYMRPMSTLLYGIF